MSSPDTGLFPDDVIPSIRAWLQESRAAVLSLASAPQPPAIYFTATDQYWWDDPALAGFTTTQVSAVATLLDSYNATPSVLGAANRRRILAEDLAIIDNIGQALAALPEIGQ